LPLEAFAGAQAVLEVRVPWLPEPLWFVPTEADAEALAAERISRGLVWTAAELKDLLTIPGITKADARTLAEAKRLFEGHAQVAPPARCSSCRYPGWWLSRGGLRVCRVCHPPAPGTEASS
jgi:hypothetical protein